MSSEDRTTDNEMLWREAAIAACKAGYAGHLIDVPFDYRAAGAATRSALAAVEREAAELRDILDSAIIQRDAAVSQLANTQAQLDEQKRLTESARRWGRSQYEVACADRRLYNQRTMEVRAAEARIEAAQKRPWLVNLVNLTQQECYDKGRADVLAALVSPLPPEDTTNRANATIEAVEALCDQADEMARTSCDPEAPPIVSGHGDVSTVEIRAALGGGFSGNQEPVSAATSEQEQR